MSITLCVHLQTEMPPAETQLETKSNTDGHKPRHQRSFEFKGRATVFGYCVSVHDLPGKHDCLVEHFPFSGRLEVCSSRICKSTIVVGRCLIWPRAGVAPIKSKVLFVAVISWPLRVVYLCALACPDSPQVPSDWSLTKDPKSLPGAVRQMFSHLDTLCS